MKRLFIILITTVITLNVWGAKAYPEPITITQKDGKTLTYRLHGDEHFNYIATTDDVLLYRDGNDYYIAIVDENGKLTSSNILAHNAGQRTAEEITLIGKQDKEKFFAASKVPVARSRSMKRTTMPSGSTTLFPHLNIDGQSPRALVILADFVDQRFKRYVESDEENDQITKEIFDQYLNAEGIPTHDKDKTLKNNFGSVAKYFRDMSGGKFTPQFDVKTVVHLQDSMKVYGNVDKKGKDDINKFLKDVCNLADATVDFSEYDMNNDNYVDLVYVIYAGYGESITGAPIETIWPKSGTENVGSYDGKQICRYGVNPELNFTPSKPNFINGIGLFCHEFSHCMGIPDIYPTTKYGQNAAIPAMEYWDLMDSGEYSYNGYRPTAYTAWEREYMGWMEMDVLKDDMSGQQIELINIDDGGKAYKIFPDDDETGNEYVCLQNIQNSQNAQRSNWNEWLADYFGTGLMVTYVYYDPVYYSLGGTYMYNEYYRVNDSREKKSRMTLVAADGICLSYYAGSSDYMNSHKEDLFPGPKGVHNLYSIPLIWAEKSMDKPLLNIQEENHVVSFYYMFEPAEKNEDISEVNVHELGMTTVSDENQIITKHEWKDAEDNIISTSYKVKNFSGVAFGLESAIVNASDCNILSLCVKPSQAITLNVTLTSETPETSNSNSKVALGMNTSSTNTASSYTRSYELEAGEWRTLAVQLSSVAAQGVDLSEINSVILSLGSEPDNQKDNILFIEDVYFCQSTQRGIATFINQTDTTTAKDKKVYTLDGRYLGNSTSGLAKGVYIINGKKTVIR
ncbi:MAG: M6 family metalloprotease domain-containing protein [Prevotella sp.]|nr:M6 family metalloprotease domain-containing protein [Prevotella sp.]